MVRIFINLLDTEYRISDLNATTTNIGTLTVHTGITIPDPTDCANNQFAHEIDTSGNLACLALVDDDIPDDITITEADPVWLADAIYTDHRFSTLNASTTEIDTLTVANTITGSIDGNAGTATALASNPTDCTNQFAYAIDAEADLTCAAVTATYMDLSGTFDYTGDLRVTGVLHATSTDFDTLLVYGDTLLTGNATSTGSMDAATFCINGADCITAWPTGNGAYLLDQWLDTTNTPTFVGLNATTTNIDTLTIYTGTTLPVNDIVTADIADGTILEVDLNADESPTDNDILTFDTTGDNFSWQTPTELGLLYSGGTLTDTNLCVADGTSGAIDCNVANTMHAAVTITGEDYASLSTQQITFSKIDAANIDLTDDYAFTGTNFNLSGVTNFLIPAVADSASEIGIDTTSDTFRYYGSAERVLDYQQDFSFTIASTTFNLFKQIPIKAHKKAITITDIYCQVDGGTSVQIFLSDATNDTETITCDGDGAEDDGSIANGAFTAREDMYVEIGSITGDVDWLNVDVTYVINSD